ncbi:MAG TPA: GNAT family N-acetyltransferase [Nocardioides sp.]|jgi:GNAT superfamily N-acetyltransferase|uniref:GNAT family N-acetyltransferase n=1 Tax=Nocardioides sp. TaxID=35761 RepID=UPI002E316A99|nr:GNAT family N-acetyltransferase [Nocardioides sp.]HEX3930585.1 GNAT family N-acetyltransferase [Nocardioides sp.]
MSVTTRVADTSDLAFLAGADTHLTPERLADLVAVGRVLVGVVDGDVVGFLRWGLFWDLVPFMNLLWVLPERRGTGVGTALVDAWEGAQHAAGHDLVLTSTMSHERSQHLYRRLGYVDSGALLLPGEPAELILRKSLA